MYDFRAAAKLKPPQRISMKVFMIDYDGEAASCAKHGCIRLATGGPADG